jgi:ATP adenylyltransferase
MKLYHSPKNPNAHLTVKDRDRVSYPTRVLLKEGQLKGRILDFGCGLGKDVEFLKTQNLDIQGYDPTYQPNYPTEKFDTIICHYVLNVLFPK